MKRMATFVALCALILGAPALVYASTAFNGHADNSIDAYGYYYVITGGQFPDGQTINGDNASGGTFRFLTDDPTWGYATDTWDRDDWFPTNAGLALTMESGGNIVYDNNGIETGDTNGYYDDSSPTGVAGLYRGYSMSNNYDWIYAGYFQLDHQVTVDKIIGYFDGNGDGVFDPNNPNIAYRMNIWSSYMDGTHPMPTNTGSFTGDLFSSDNVAGTFSWSDTGVVRVYSGWAPGTTDPIYRLTYTLDSPITLNPGEYFFSHDAVIVPEPLTMLALASGLVGLGGYLLRRRVA